MAAAIAGRTTVRSEAPLRSAVAFQVGLQTLGLDLPSCNGAAEISALDETAAEIRIEVISTVHHEVTIYAPEDGAASS